MHEYGWASIGLFVAGIRGRLFPAMRADPPRKGQRDLRQAGATRSASITRSGSHPGQLSPAGMISPAWDEVNNMEGRQK